MSAQPGDRDGPWNVGSFNSLTGLLAREDFIKCEFKLSIILRV
jgi:hypothetical protein